MRELRRLYIERAKQCDVLGRVGEMILTANHVRNAHLDVIHHVDQMKHRLVVRAHDHEIGLFLFAIGQFPHHITADQVRNGHRLALHAEPDGAVVLVGEPLGLQLLHAPHINLRALGLIIRHLITHAVAGRIVARRAFIPVQPKPAQAIENHIDCLRRVTFLVRVLHSQHKFAARMTGIEPIKQRSAGTSNMQIPSGTRRKSYTDTHGGGR